MNQVNNTVLFGTAPSLTHEQTSWLVAGVAVTEICPWRILKAQHTGNADATGPPENNEGENDKLCRHR
jgi:hypothetical protein